LNFELNTFEIHMTIYQHYLEQTGETGVITEVIHSLLHIAGLPGATPLEIVLFETGEFGQILSLTPAFAEVIVFTKSPIRVGTKVTRTGHMLEVPAGEELIGHTIDPFGTPLNQTKTFHRPTETRPVDISPSGISTRKRISTPFSTGITLIDLMVPLGKGQRELVLGDRKTGKTHFLMQTMLYQAKQGALCIYAGIGKKKLEIKQVEEFFQTAGITNSTIIVASSSHDPVGVIYQTPFTAMALAEYFKDKGRDVVIILDDLSSHAKFYREISLLGNRFPGRNSYPGDIFYTHAKLLERAGNFITPTGQNSITCLPVVETTQGDLSGYIQTNLMSMTDGHIYFDIDLFIKGRRPAVNMFLSVTRVGRQTQSELDRTINRELNSFLTLYDKLQNFVHFGAELTTSVKETLSQGERILDFFTITSEKAIFPHMQLILFGLLWQGVWHHKKFAEMRNDIEVLLKRYETDQNFRQIVSDMIQNNTSFNTLLKDIQTHLPELVPGNPVTQVPTLPAAPAENPAAK
jgi:F-type H+-transporting ATPase subunit alpha